MSANESAQKYNIIYTVYGDLQCLPLIYQGGWITHPVLLPQGK